MRLPVLPMAVAASGILITLVSLHISSFDLNIKLYTMRHINLNIVARRKCDSVCNATPETSKLDQIGKRQHDTHCFNLISHCVSHTPSLSHRALTTAPLHTTQKTRHKPVVSLFTYQFS